MEEENNISENPSPKKNVDEVKSSEEERNNENIVTSSSSLSNNEKSEERNENQINANVSPKCMNTNQCKKANQQQHQQSQQHKKYNNRRRKRSYRTRKNSGNFKFNPKGKRRDVIYNKNDQALRHQLFFTDSQRLVPYNTNEFLMEDHYPKISPNFNYHPYNHDSFSSSDCGMSGSLDEDEFLTKEFRLDYENLRSQQLHDMSKEELVQEYLKLENQTEMSMKAKENEIQALNNKIKDLTRRLAPKNCNDVRAESEDSESDSSSSSSSSSSCSSSDSDCEMEHNANDEYTASVITEPQTVSC